MIRESYQASYLLKLIVNKENLTKKKPNKQNKINNVIKERVAL